MRRFRLMMTIFAAVCCMLPSAKSMGNSQPNGDLTEPRVLARVNGEEITAGAMLSQFSSRHAGHAKFLGGDEEARRFLNVLIENRLLVQEAYALGLDEDPEAKAVVRQYVDDQSTSLLIRRELEDKSRPTDDEVYQVWQDKAGVAFRVRQIAVDRKEDAEAIRAAIEAGTDPELLARSCSVAPSSRSGGNMIVSWGMFEPGLEDEVFRLEDGELSRVIPTPAGYEVIHLIERIATPRPEFAEVSERIAKVLSMRKFEERKAAFSSELWNRYGVVVSSLDFSPGALLALRLTVPDTVVATWEGGSLTLMELADPDELRSWAILAPRRGVTEVQTRLRATVNAPLVVLEASRRGIPSEQEMLSRAQEFQDLLVQNLLLRDHVYKPLGVTAEEARRYFEGHRSEFIRPEERHVSHIMVRSEDEAKIVRQELMDGADFGEAAKRYSRDFATGLSGGDLGWITPARVPPGFNSVLALEEGEVSTPLKSDSGWHLVKVLEIRPEKLLDFEEVKDKLEQVVLDSKKREASEYWVDRLRDAAEIEIDNDAISQFVKENELRSFEGPAPGHQVPAGAMKPH